MIALALREKVFRANLALNESGLVMSTFGNVSGADPEHGYFAIKPSGVPYTQMTARDMVVVSIETGEVIDGVLRPSSDTPTHVELYRAFKCGGIVHTHSEYASAFGQARRPIRCLGTTHADYFRGDVPVTRPMTEAEVAGDYERETGLVIVETFRSNGIDPLQVPAALVANHGPFVWGPDAMAAVEFARVLESLARTNLLTNILAPDEPRPEAFLIDKHYLRKHGPGAYYGQAPKPD
jgi:L-ribulose-5-phosphate 4-epimerase